MSSLAGKRIIITRPRPQAGDLCAALEALGAAPILFPTIEIAPLPDYARLDAALRDLRRYHWVIFTSVNGVAACFDRLRHLGQPGEALQAARVAAIGPATAGALAEHGVPVAFVPGEYVAEAVAAGLGPVAGQRILLPRAELAREALAVELARNGASVDEIPAYRTVPAAPDPAGLAELRRGVDAVTFTSSSTVRNFAALLRSADLWPFDRLAGGAADAIRPKVACLGPITAGTAKELGLPVDVQASTYTVAGLVAALEEYYGVATRAR